MNRTLSQFTYCAVVCLLSGAAAAASMPGDVSENRALAESPPAANWLVRGGAFQQQQFSSLNQITESNVANLGLAWSTDIDSPMGLASEPIVVDGVIYLSASLSYVYAIDALSGKILWRFDPHVRLDFGTQNSYAARVNRGVAVWKGKVYVSTGDCRVVAIDAATGNQRWEAPICDPHETGSTGAPLVAKGKVFIGYNGSDDQVRGSLVAFDAETGKQAWRFWTVPGDPAKGFETPALEMAARTWQGSQWWWHGGGAAWNAITYDPVTGLVLFATSTAHHGEGNSRKLTSGGAKLFSGCIVAVNPDTGEYVWHYQTSTPDHQRENFHIVLADLVIKDRTRHVAMTVPRDGGFYVIDAQTGELISKSSLVPQGVGGKVSEPAMRPLDDGTPADGTEQCEGCWGVHNWWPMSYNPHTGLVYVPITNKTIGPTSATQFTFVGNLMAWDPVKNTERWRVVEPVAINSGVLSTAGNLVFQGEGTGEFSAYSADSGAKLWSVRTGSAIDTVPVSFSVKGEQYILVPVGWGSAFRLFGRGSMMATRESKRGPSRLLAFKLGANTPFPSPNINIPLVPLPPKQTFPKDAIRRGETLYETRLCGGCHSPGLDGSDAWTVDGAIPDLRYMPGDAHRDWYAIVLGGSHREQGMLSFGVEQHFPEVSALTPKMADDIHAYVIDVSWKAYYKDHPDQAQQRDKR